MLYRVDSVPWPLRPAYLAVTWVCGAVFYLYYWVCRVTSHVSIEGPGNLDLSQHAIFCLWHESWWSYFVVFLRYRSPHAMMSHAAAYMRPAHVLFRLMGASQIILGSSGEEGRRAANQIARLVAEGYSTTISPDGPYGPARVLKKGVLHVALQSGVPIVPVMIHSSRFIRLRTWDDKKFPLPFCRITVTIQEAIVVESCDFVEAAARIVRALNESRDEGRRRRARPKHGATWRPAGSAAGFGRHLTSDGRESPIRTSRDTQGTLSAPVSAGEPVLWRARRVRAHHRFAPGADACDGSPRSLLFHA